MAIPKVMGIETEYGITVRNQPDFNPILSSLLLINSYETYRSSRIRWDYEAESPLRDARGFEYMEDKEVPSKEESRLINLILSNGARFYVDHAHPEYSSPETTNPRDCVIWDKAGERILNLARTRAEAASPPEQRILIHKDNTDRQGQLLRHPRELPDGPQGAVRADRPAPDAVLRQPADLHRRGQGRRREQRRALRLPDLPARGLPRDRGGARDDAQPPHHQHARRAPRRPREVPPPARDRGRRQHERGVHVPQDGHHGHRAQHDRGRLHRPGPLARESRARLPEGVARPRLPRDGPAQGRARPHRASTSSGSSSTWRTATTATREHEPWVDDVLARWGSVLDRLAQDPDEPRPRARLGDQAPAHRELHGQARARMVGLARGDDRPAVPRRPARARGSSTSSRNPTRSSGSSPRTRSPRRSTIRPRTPAPTSAACACRSTRTRSSRRPGTR